MSPAPAHLALLPPSVLVVADDEAMRQSLRFALEVEGYRVEMFHSAETLLARRDVPTDACLVVDQQLPGQSGLDLIVDVRARDGRIPAVLIATQPSQRLRRWAALEDVAIVEKPLLGRGLLDAIHSALD
jgi:FixJ family two-component response regulator